MSAVAAISLADCQTKQLGLFMFVRLTYNVGQNDAFIDGALPCITSK